jgi:hypothetical protein
MVSLLGGFMIKNLSYSVVGFFLAFAVLDALLRFGMFITSDEALNAVQKLIN